LGGQVSRPRFEIEEEKGKKLNVGRVEGEGTEKEE
jgi:hypothetical protein